ncbi:MAG: hypothetical protein ACE5D3_06260 [Candidatus Binatia bacterium]
MGISRPWLWVGFFLALVPAPVHAARFVIVNADDASSGLNDPTPVAPLAGNDGTTLGEQRLRVLQAAAERWGALLESDVDIVVRAQFLDLGGSSFAAVLGSASAVTIHRDFAGSPRPATFYTAALANALAGQDLNGSIPELYMRFNAALDTPEVLGSRTWYYGTNGSPDCSGGTCGVDLLSVALHEIAHGLGFTTFFSYVSGDKFNTLLRCPDYSVCDNDADCLEGQCSPRGFDDAYMLWLSDTRSGRALPDMSSAERVAAISSNGDLHWTGPEVSLHSSFLSDGVNHSSGAVRMFDPPRVAGGSSVSHFNNILFPDQVMEPGYTGPNHALGLPDGLSLSLLVDLGWSRLPLCGDANGSGALDINDALLVLRRAVGLSECSLERCDADGDGSVGIVDALLVLRAVVGIEASLVCGTSGALP